VNGFDSIIKQLESQKAAIERALAALREVGGEVSGSSAPLPATPASASDKRSAGQKARWAAKKAAEVAPSAAPAKRKGGMTQAGREKLRQAMKKRWAVKRAASQVKATKRARKKAA
jgi:hypothetical protein